MKHCKVLERREIGMDFFKTRKAQSATEYLMTYGWAILAITIVGALLYTQVFSQRSCATAGQSGFPLINTVAPDGNEFSVKTDGSVSVALKNNFGKNVTVTIINGTTAGTGYAVPAASQLIQDGETSAFTTGTGVARSGTAGKCYSETLTITYNATPGVDIKSSGTLNGRY